MGRRTAAAALASAIFAGSWTIGISVADPAPPSLVLRDVGSQVTTAIDIDDMYPGLAVTRPYLVGLNATAPESTLTMLVDNVADLERGCNAPERKSGDLTCSDDEGEMSRQLLVSATLASAPPAGACDAEAGEAEAILAPTTLADLALVGHLELQETATPGELQCLLLMFDLPWAADNLVQTDLARFDLTIGAEQVTDTGVDSEETTRPNGGVAGESTTDGALATAVLPRRALLPVTGSAVLQLGLAGAIAALFGAGILRWTRWPRPRR